ncbi:hypothetical protein [Streptomyces paradoxus]|uniref:Integral membrane protein n=1 Tax=Streptomyces paradoxus TaxID=66375 RepID=A0A7W9TFV7_9ACTN|nr:hypothetical protein [Streptomyces paradoxus]MBB6078662.1 hypothetical protein [Streptomyces paradoxus]
MRSARMLLATATATAALAITAPAAYAEAMGDWDNDSSSYSKEHHKDGKHHKPHGGVHTGGGALAAVTADDEWDGGKGDHEGKEEEHGKEKGHEKGSWKGKHDKPHGGVHTGGGALAAVNSDDDWDNPKHDTGTHKEDDWGGKHDEHGKGSWEGKRDKHGKHDKHDKPRGGVHTGGGGLASAPGVTAGGMAVLAVAGTGLYALRRQKASRGTA